jgi:hypothetical protein
MIKRHHQILAGILIVQIVLSVVVFWPRPSTAGQREPLFPGLEAEDVSALTIKDAEGNVVKLEKAAGEWVLPEAGDYPARAEDVSSFLEKLVALSTGRLVTSSDTSHRRLQVSPDEFARRVSFEMDEGTEHTVYLGSSPQYGSAHFRLDGQSETYLTSDLSTFDVNATVSTWVDATYPTAAQEEVNRMTLENANGTFVFEREGEDAWTLADLGEDEALDTAQVTAVVRRVSSIRMREPLGTEERPSYGMEDPNAVVTLETEEKTVTLRVGAKDSDDAGYIVKSSESDYYVVVADTSVSALVENGRDAFLKAPPTPEGESSGS